mmetsp:Transcript_9616/g.23729  ORF Transcript_9616/g.23729 Transcript_9616/m.23729 type:complete len:273 (-) Transcript_9616:537-1355(-)
MTLREPPWSESLAAVDAKNAKARPRPPLAHSTTKMTMRRTRTRTLMSRRWTQQRLGLLWMSPLWRRASLAVAAPITWRGTSVWQAPTTTAATAPPTTFPSSASATLATRDPSRITPRRAKRLPMRSLPGPSPPSSPPTSMGEGGDYRGGCNLQRRLLLPLAAAALRSRPEPVTTGSHRAGRPPGPSEPGSLVSSLRSSRRRVTHALPPRPTPLPPVLADTLAAASPSSTWKGMRRTSFKPPVATPSAATSLACSPWMTPPPTWTTLPPRWWM